MSVTKQQGDTAGWGAVTIEETEKQVPEWDHGSGL